MTLDELRRELEAIARDSETAEELVGALALLLWQSEAVATVPVPA